MPQYPLIAVAVAQPWRARLAAAATAAGVPVADTAPGVPGVHVLTCLLGGLAGLVPLLEVGPVQPRPSIGAHSDSITDLELRDAVADVAALLSLHGNVVHDLDARRPSRQPTPDPDVVVSGYHRPKWTIAVSLPVATAAQGRRLRVRLTAGPGHVRSLLELARLVEADVLPTCA